MSEFIHLKTKQKPVLWPIGVLEPQKAAAPVSLIITPLLHKEVFRKQELWVNSIR